MIVRVAVRSLAIRPLRTALLACGFGLGIAVMAELLGIGEVILDQYRSPALQGGGDLLVSGTFGSIDNARYILSTVLGRAGASGRIAAKSPSKRATLYLIKQDMVLPLIARGGVPSLENAVGDPEVARQRAWRDAAGDAAWSRPDPADLLRSMDRFHKPAEAPEFASSWAEWLYFNGHTATGTVRFYLTFLVSPSRQTESPGSVLAGVRLQLERAGRLTTYSARAAIDERTLLENAPDLEIGDNRVRLEGMRYRIHLRLQDEARSSSILTGDLALDAVAGRSLPPAVVYGARGWLSGYVVPVLSGSLNGTLRLGSEHMTATRQPKDEEVALDGATGYHDHNWGFWQDVRWQWGQVAHEGLSFIYGRVFPPAAVADPERVPGFLGVLGPDGPIGLSTDVSITERGSTGGPENGPEEMTISARSDGLDLNLRFSVERSIRTPLALVSMDFLQLAGIYHVTGRAGGGPLDFRARGAAETFRPR